MVRGHVGVAPLEATWGCHIPRSWSYWKLWLHASAGNQTPVLWESSNAPNQSAFSSAPQHIFFLNAKSTTAYSVPSPRSLLIATLWFFWRVWLTNFGLQFLIQWCLMLNEISDYLLERHICGILLWFFRLWRILLIGLSEMGSPTLQEGSVVLWS